jgi:hypothetical protein
MWILIKLLVPRESTIFVSMLPSLSQFLQVCVDKPGLSHLARGKVLDVAALPEKVATLADPGTKALAEVETVAAIAKREIVFFIVKIIVGAG